MQRQCYHFLVPLENDEVQAVLQTLERPVPDSSLALRKNNAVQIQNLSAFVTTEHFDSTWKQMCMRTGRGDRKSSQFFMDADCRCRQHAHGFLA